MPAIGWLRNYNRRWLAKDLVGGRTAWLNSSSALIVAGLLSGTQPVTVMGLLLLRTGPNGARNSWAFLAGAFTVETALLIFANLVLGGTVESDSDPGRFFLIIRVVLGGVLIVTGLMLRRPAKKEAPPVPKSLQRLRNLRPVGAFIAGILLADYVGPALASLAIATADVSTGGRLAASLLYTLLATGIPATFLIISLTSNRAGDRINNGMDWVMGHRRQLASWIALVLGVLLVADGVIGLLVLE